MRSCREVFAVSYEVDRRNCTIGSVLKDESREKETIQEEVDAQGVKDSALSSMSRSQPVIFQRFMHTV